MSHFVAYAIGSLLVFANKQEGRSVEGQPPARQEVGKGWGTHKEQFEQGRGGGFHMQQGFGSHLTHHMGPTFTPLNRITGPLKTFPSRKLPMLTV